MPGWGGSPSTGRRTAGSLLLATALVTGCAASPDPSTGTTSVDLPSAVVPHGGTPTEANSAGHCRSPRETSTASKDQVLVFFVCSREMGVPHALHAFARSVDPGASLEHRLATAINAYFDGPSPSEGTRYVTFGSPDIVNSTAVVGTRAIVDIDLDGGIASTSYQSGHVWTVLRSLAFQFPTISELEPRHDGSCAALGHAVQAGECLLALRDGASVPGP